MSCGDTVDPDVAYPDRGPDGKITRGRCQAFADLIAFAFSCELTNVASHVFSCAACHGAYEEAGLGNVTFHEDYGHRLSPGGTAAAEEGFNNGVAYAMTCVADLLERLQKTPDGPGKNLLDNTAIYVTSCVSLPWEHRMDDYPLLVLAKGPGKLKGNVHHRGAGGQRSRCPSRCSGLRGGRHLVGSAEGLTSEVIPECWSEGRSREVRRPVRRRSALAPAAPCRRARTRGPRPRARNRPGPCASRAPGVPNW